MNFSKVTPFQIACLGAATALALRLPGINQSLTFDEIYSLFIHINQPLSKIHTHPLFADFHVLYTFLAHFMIKATGHHLLETTLRLPALVAGVAAVPIVYLYSRKFFDTRTALAALFLLVFSHYHIEFSREAKAYSLMVFFAILAIFDFLDYLAQGKPSAIWKFFLWNTLGLYAHPYFFLLSAAFILPFALHLLKKENRNHLKRRDIILSAACAVTITVLQFLPRLSSIIDYTQGMKRTPDPYTLSTAQEFITALGGGMVSGLLFIGLLLFGLWKSPPLLRHLFYGCLITSGLFLTLFRPVFIYARFFLFLLPVFLLIVAHGINRLLTLLEQKGLAARYTLPACLGLFLLLFAYDEYNGFRYPKQDFRSSAEFLQSQLKESDVAAVVGFAGGYFHYYFKGALSRILKPGDLRQLMETCRKQNSRLYLTAAWGEMDLRKPEEYAFIKKEFEEIKVFKANPTNNIIGDIFIYKLEPSPGL